MCPLTTERHALTGHGTWTSKRHVPTAEFIVFAIVTPCLKLLVPASNVTSRATHRCSSSSKFHQTNVPQRSRIPSMLGSNPARVLLLVAVVMAAISRAAAQQQQVQVGTVLVLALGECGSNTNYLTQVAAVKGILNNSSIVSQVTMTFDSMQPLGLIYCVLMVCNRMGL